MRCSTCGERLAPSEDRCSICGAAAPHLLDRSPPGVRRCRRCQYTEEGVGYFSRPGHVALLVVVSIFTYGAGGLVYWLLRRGHRVCPNCGLSWTTGGRYPLGPPPGETADPLRHESNLPSGGLKRRALGIILALIATVVLALGTVWLDAVVIVVGSAIGAAGGGAFFWGWQALRERRRALTHALERRVLQLASRRRGTLTVTEVAADLDLSLPAAERVLIGLDDGFRVRSEITDEGVLIYEFPEVLHRGTLG